MTLPTETVLSLTALWYAATVAAAWHLWRLLPAMRLPQPPRLEFSLSAGITMLLPLYLVMLLVPRRIWEDIAEAKAQKEKAERDLAVERRRQEWIAREEGK